MTKAVKFKDLDIGSYFRLNDKVCQKTNYTEAININRYTDQFYLDPIDIKLCNSFQVVQSDIEVEPVNRRKSSEPTIMEFRLRD